MIHTLIPMRQFVLETTEQSDGNSDALCAIIYEYAQFLSLPLKLGYFVACNENDVPLSEPKEENEKYNTGHLETDFNNFANEFNEWQAAQSSVLFEGFEYEFTNILKLNGNIIWHGELKGIVEEIAYLDLPLTPTAKKMIYGQ